MIHSWDCQSRNGAPNVPSKDAKSHTWLRAFASFITGDGRKRARQIRAASCSVSALQRRARSRGATSTSLVTASVVPTGRCSRFAASRCLLSPRESRTSTAAVTSASGSKARSRASSSTESSWSACSGESWCPAKQSTIRMASGRTIAPRISSSGSAGILPASELKTSCALLAKSLPGTTKSSATTNPSPHKSPPETTEFIGRQLLSALANREAAA